MSEKLTSKIIAELSRTIGHESPLPQFNTAATADAVRHFALGRGDDNPLFCDQDYAAGSRFGGLIAPNTFVLSCGFPRSRGLPGIHALFTGIDLHCHVPIKVGTEICATTALHALDERQGDFAGRQYQQTSITKYSDNQGQLLSTLYSHAFRMERGKAGKSEKYINLERKTYSQEELAEIEKSYDDEVKNRRGKSARFWNDVGVGETLTDMVKGPLTVTDNIAFLVGFGTVFVRAHRMWHEFRSRHPGAGVKDEHGVWDVPERVHWDEGLAASIGMPGPYDYGPQRIAWFDHRISDWIGDEGWLNRISVKLTAPNFVGDTSWIKGVVTEKSDNGGVTLELKCEDQRGRITATAIAEVTLPCR
jgi:acyl dehydratase